MKELEITVTSTTPRRYGLKNLTRAELQALYAAVKAAHHPDARELYDIKQILEETLNETASCKK